MPRKSKFDGLSKDPLVLRKQLMEARADVERKRATIINLHGQLEAERRKTKKADIRASSACEFYEVGYDRGRVAEALLAVIMNKAAVSEVKAVFTTFQDDMIEMAFSGEVNLVAKHLGFEPPVARIGNVGFVMIEDKKDKPSLKVVA